MAKVNIPKSDFINPRLKSFRILIGNWKIIATHPQSPGKIFHGTSSVKCIENGAFLLIHTEFEDEIIPNSTSIIGSDDMEKDCFMHYFDDRVVSRQYRTSLKDILWKCWREVPNFSQRFVGTIIEKGNKIIGLWHLSGDGSTWNKDLELVYNRVESGEFY